MRKYKVYFTDNPFDAATFKCNSEKEARENGNLYIRQWGLAASVDHIEDAGEIVELTTKF